MSDDSHVTFHYHKGVRWEWFLVTLVSITVLAFYGGRLSVPPSAEAIAHKQEMERLRSEEAARQSEVVGEILAFQTALVTETMLVAMDPDGEFGVPDVEVPLEVE